MSFPSYPEYKDSGVDWLGPVPTHWTSVAIKYMALHAESIFIDGDWIESQDISGDEIRYITTGNVGEGIYKEQGTGYISEEKFEELSCTEVFPGDILISRLNPPIGRACIVPDLKSRIVTSVDNVIFRPDNKYIKEFLVYLFSCQEYFEQTSNLARGATMQRISRGLLGNIRALIPSQEEQKCIVAFLNGEVKKIDGLIAEQENLIALLKEKRQAVISHAVTKGLDPNVPMKDSGIEWLGKVPAHWKIKRVSWVFSMISSGTTPSSDTDKYYGGDISWVTTGELRESVIFETEKTVTNQAVAELSALRIYPVGTLLIALYGATIGRLGFLGVEAATNQACCAMVGPVGVVPRFVFHALMAAKEHLLLIASGGGQPNINQDKVRSLRIPVPELAEQERIVSELDDAVNRIDLLIDQAEHGIRLLSERRSALISAVVTGKIDVRQYKAREVA